VTGSLSDNVLHFKHPSSFSKILSLCGRIRMVLEGLLNHNYTDSLENIFINAQTQMLLLYSLECMLGEKEVEAFRCKFLANEEDREKINLAREILLEHIGEPLTIRGVNSRRYFMSIAEAVLLVLQAGAAGKGGEIFVLDMGEPVKIVDLAEQLIRLSGLRPELDIRIERQAGHVEDGVANVFYIHPWFQDYVAIRLQRSARSAMLFLPSFSISRTASSASDCERL